MALPMQLRIKTTSERLRTNHIDLLEYTERLSQENERLKKNMEKVLRSSSLPIPTACPLEDDEPAEDAEKARMQQEIDSLKTEVETLGKKLLASEVDKKTLKAKAQLTQPNNDERLSNLRARLEEESRLRAECSELLMASQDQLTQLQASNALLSEELASARQEAQSEQLKAYETIKLKESEAFELDSKLKEILAEMDGMSDYHAQCMDKMMRSFVQELEKKVAAERDVKEKQVMVIDSLTEELNSVRAELQNQRRSAVAKKGVIQEAEDTAPAPPPSAPAEGQVCCKCKGLLDSNAEGPDLEVVGKGTVNFPEYIRILEENRLLKIQLANANTSGGNRQSARVQRRSSGSGRPGSSIVGVVK